MADQKPVEETMTTTSMAARMSGLSLSAQTIHADDYLNSHQAVAPPMHLSTTYRYSDDPDQLIGWDSGNPNNINDTHVYSRDSHPNTTRLEAILTSILSSSSSSSSTSSSSSSPTTTTTIINPALTYSSGLSAFHAMMVFLNPKRVCISGKGGYHGCHGVLQLMTKLTGLEVIQDLDCPDESLGPGDVIHVETPMNPTGEATNLEFYSDKARRIGCYLTVDATFAPPPLLDPFKWGADMVMHSGTKYLGGHSDLLCGVVGVAGRHCGEDKDSSSSCWMSGLRKERLVMGSVMGSMEGWLTIRSLRTLDLRVRKQSRDAGELVRWLDDQISSSSLSSSSKGEGGDDGEIIRKMVKKVLHASLQAKTDEDGGWLRRQYPNGYGAVFSLILRDEVTARRLPSKLRLFHHATSLGGVESLIEWRAMTDPTVDRALVRVSVGVEGWEDLRRDLVEGLRGVCL